MKRFLVFLFILIGFMACKSNKMASQTKNVAQAGLEGNWELNYVSAPGSSFEEVYKEKKPQIKFELADNRFSGNTSCNSFSGKLKTEGNQIDFRDPFMMTKMFCPGGGENLFVESLQKVNKYAISDGNTLNFIMGDIAIMRFTRKQSE